MSEPLLQTPGWHEATRHALEKLIRKGAGRRLPVAFDFDNTLIHADIGEATLAVLARSGKLAPGQVSQALCPPFRPPPGREVRLESSPDLLAYYEALLAPTVHGGQDPFPLATAYAWAVEVMEGLPPLDIIQATRTAYELGAAGRPAFIEVTPGQTGFPAPGFHPAMVELVGVLLDRQYDVWVISASNVWSVRWMVLEALNPRLRQLGLRTGLRPDHVMGISTLLADRRGGLHKDMVLVRDQPGYAALKPSALAGLRLTSRLQFPVPTYSGKIACVFDLIGRRPYLCAGDAPSDHGMMALSEHRLWMARLEKPGYQAATAKLIGQTGRAGWLFQPVLAKPEPGFVARPDRLAQQLKPVPQEVRKSLRLLAPWL